MSKYTFDANNNVVEPNYIDHKYPIHPVDEDEVLIGNKYLTDASGKEIYPKRKNQDEYEIPNTYAQSAGKSYYPQKADGKEFVIGNTYIKEGTKEIYPHLSNNNEYIHNKVFATTDNVPRYPKDTKGNELFDDVYVTIAGKEIYPKLASGEEIVVDNKYAKNQQNVEYYPTAKIGTDEYYLVIGPKNNPKLIRAYVDIDFYNLHKTVKLNNVDYIYTHQHTNDMGDLFFDVMSSSDKTTYDAWKVIKPALPAQFKKHPTVHKAFTRNNGTDYYTFTGPYVEALADFDKKDRIHLYNKVNNDKQYYQTAGANKLVYKDMDKIVFTHKTHKVLSTSPWVFFERKDDNTIDLFNLDPTHKKVLLNKSLTVTDFVHRIDKTTQSVIGKELAKKTYFIYEKDELVKFDYIKQKTEMKRYYMKNDQKQYFKWNGNVKEDMNAPTDDIDPFEEEGTTLFGKFSIITIYIAIGLLIVAIYMFYFRTPQKPTGNNFFR